jgi:hypothetical protein
MGRLILFAIVLAVAAVIWIAKALVGAVSGSQSLRRETLRSQTQKTMRTTARGVNWLNEQWEQAKAAADSSSASKVAQEVEENMFAIETAAGRGDWERAAAYAERQDPLLARYIRCEGASEEHLYGFLRKSERLRSIRDPEHMEWITDELAKRGLQPMGIEL